MKKKSGRMSSKTAKIFPKNRITGIEIAFIYGERAKLYFSNTIFFSFLLTGVDFKKLLHAKNAVNFY
jgi:hypothetical protein